MIMFDRAAVSGSLRRASLLALAALLQIASPAPAAQQPAKPLPPGEAARICVALECRRYECPTVRCNLAPYNECVKRCKNGG
jgi:hypothetical protein